ncbi:MAG: hypothetical protein M3M91_03000 [Thermoproteota archaeon]|nr:hypothetical protein [Thermoproteota archaeon]
MNFRTNMTSTAALSQPLLTRDEILDLAKKLAHDRNWSVKLALAVLQYRLDADRRYLESEMAYSLLDEEVIRGR